MRRGLRPPMRGVPLGRSIRGRGGSRVPANTVRVKFSDSSSDESYSDDLPIIKTKSANDKVYSYSERSYSDDQSSSNKVETQLKTKITADLVSDYDYSDNFEEGIPVVSENNPIPNEELKVQNKHKEHNTKNTTSQALNINDKEKNLNTLNEKTDNTEENINTTNQNQPTKPEISNNHNQDQKVTEITKKTVIKETPEENHKSNQEINKDSQNQAIASINQPDSETPTPSINLLDDDCNLPFYRIVWKKSIHSKSRIQLVFNDDIIFHSKEKKTKIGNCFVICTDSNVDCFSKSYQGSLKISQSSTRFTLFAPQGEQYQTHEGEVMGLSFYDPKEIKCYGVRAFRIALPKKQPYFPSTKDMNLSKIAQKNVKSDDIQIYSSRLPELFPGPVLKLQFGNVHVVSSVKNFILEDDNGNVIFMIYKSSNGMCSLRIAPPITPLIAFALSIAIITSRK